MKPIIDISYWQPPSEINYDLLAGAVSGVILRACYGTGKDTRFEQHYSEFTRRGIPVGAYHYIVGNMGMQNQAQAFQSAVTGKELRLGLWADVEDVRDGTRLTKQNVVDYMRIAESALGELGIYTSRYRWEQIMGTGSHPYGTRKLWVANYGVSAPALPVGWTSWWLWQYASNGSLPGYAGSLDMNNFSGTESEYRQWTGQDEGDPLYQVEVVCIALNIRSGAGVSYPVLYAVPKGTILDVYEEVNNWIRVGQGKYCSGNSAYVKRVEPTDKEKLDTLWAWYEEEHP